MQKQIVFQYKYIHQLLKYKFYKCSNTYTKSVTIQKSASIKIQQLLQMQNAKYTFTNKNSTKTFINTQELNTIKSSNGNTTCDTIHMQQTF